MTVMLMHEWIRYRKQQVKEADGENEDAEGIGAEEASGAAEAVVEEESVASEVAEVDEIDVAPAEAEQTVAAEPSQEAEGTGGDGEASKIQASGASAETEAPVEVESPVEPETAVSDDDGGEDEGTQAAPDDAEGTVRDREAVLSSLQEELDRAGNSMKDRLSQLQARQKQLPIDVEEADDDEEEAGKLRKSTETRQELVQRLLDPTLTLREASLLIDVCPTTVRRYTNRGLLNCFRTPGNQRRFHLSDILEFLERRERGEV
jgi:hypothetical protein